MHFDLISDLHIDFWPESEQIDFNGLGTSLLAVVAGDISMDWQKSYDKLVELGQYYRHVIFVDGNHEHAEDRNNIMKNCADFYEKIRHLDNVTYLHHRSSIILDDTAFIGCNGWWTFDYGQPEFSQEECWQRLLAESDDEMFQAEVMRCAELDAENLCMQVQIFNNDPRIRNIVIVTHTAPLQQFAFIPDHLAPYHKGRAGNSRMINALQYNLHNKVRAWCFGHTHTRYDEVINDIRFVCHPRGRPGEKLQQVYYPKLIEV